MKWGLRFALLLLATLALVFPGSALGFEPVSSFGTVGEGAGEMLLPGGIAVTEDGSSYIADRGNNRVDFFSPEGAFVRAFGKAVNPAGGDVCTAASGCRRGEASGAAGALNAPEDVAIDSAGNVYVVEAAGDRVDVFSPEGLFVRALGAGVKPGGGDVCTAATGCLTAGSGESAGEMNQPLGIDVDLGGTLYVSDSGNNRVDVFSAKGSFTRAFGKEVVPGGGNVCTTECKAGVASGEAGAISAPYGVALDLSGQVTVADSGNNRVSAFTPGGSFVRAFGRAVKPGGGNVCTAGCQVGEASGAAGALAAASAIATAPSGNLLVADASNNRINEFSPGGLFVRAFGAGVISGENAFQVCTAASGCRAGVDSTVPGATPASHGTAVDCRGAIYATEEPASRSLARVERFGEPGIASLSCSGAPPVTPIVAPVLKPPSNRFNFAGLVKNHGNGSAVLFVRVPGPGRVILFGRGVRRLARGARQAKRVRLPVRPKVPLKRFLKQHGKGKIRVEVTFEPTGGAPRTLEKVIVLRRKRG